MTVLASRTAILENSRVGTHHFSQDNRVHDTIPKVPIAEPRRLEIAKQGQHRGYYFLTGPNLAGHWMLIVLLIVHTTIHHTSSNLSLSLINLYTEDQIWALGWGQLESGSWMPRVATNMHKVSTAMPALESGCTEYSIHRT